jgi:hypothetical protein
LDGTAYTILAVVRRNSGRDSNYFVNTGGSNCNPTFGTTCTSNTVLHLGWVGARAVRLGQYDRDVTLDAVPAFSTSPPLTLIQAVSGPGTGKLVAVLEPGFNQAAIDPRVTALLATSGGLFIGGSPFPGPVPDWHFTGDIFAILIYTRELSGADLAVAQEYLRLRYGPA